MNFRRLLPVCALGLCVALPAISQSQESKSKGVISVAQKEKTTKTEAKKPTVRLPNNFGKIDLTEKQKDSVRDIMSKYSDQIDKLEEQIKSLKDKRDAEVQKVLSADQKSKLASLEAEAKKKKASKTDKGEKESDDEK